jgi:hypothetical protein
MKALVFLFCGLAWLGCRSALAEDITLPDPLKVANDVYTGSLYVKHDAAYMTFTHESGTARVLISSLPADVRKLLDYDPHAAETQLERARGRRDELTPAPEIPVVTIHGKLIANTEKGLFIAVIRDTGRTRNVQQWSGGAATKSEDSDSGSTSVSSDNTRIASTEEPIYETV